MNHTFQAKNAWNQCVALLKIATDLGVSMESLVLQREIEKDKGH